MIFDDNVHSSVRGKTRKVALNKDLKKVLSGDIVVIDQADIDRQYSQALIDKQVSAVLNVAEFSTGDVPNFGPNMLISADIILVENIPAEAVSKVKNGRMASLDADTLYYGEKAILQGHRVTEEDVRSNFERASVTLVDHMSALSGNTAEFVSSEAPLLLEGIGIPDTDVPMLGKTVLVAQESTLLSSGFASTLEADLQKLKKFIKYERPIIIAVENAANTLNSYKIHSDVIIATPDSVSTEILQSAQQVIIPAQADGTAVGIGRIQDLGISAVTFPAATENPGDLALLFAHYHGADVIVNAGSAYTLDNLFSSESASQAPSKILTYAKVAPQIVSADAVYALQGKRYDSLSWLWAIIGILFALTVVVCVIGFAGQSDFLTNLTKVWNDIFQSAKDVMV